MQFSAFAYRKKSRHDPYDTDFNFTVAVKDGLWSGCAVFNTDYTIFSEFVNDLSEMYRSLSGTADITDLADCESSVAFEADKTGHIHIEGTLCDNFREGPQLLKFCFTVDQCDLKEFIAQLDTAAAKISLPPYRK